MATIVNARDKAIMAVNPRTLSVSLPSNIIVPSGNVTGLDDVYDSTKQVILKASSLLFQIPKTGATLPANISMTAVLKNLTGTVTFSVVDGTCTYSVNGNTITILPTNLTTNTATIKASITVNSVVYEDRVTIGKVAEGTDSVTGLLSNESCVVSTPFDGTVSSFANTGGTFHVFDGLTNMTGNAAVVYSVVSPTGVTMNIAATGVYTVTAMSADTGVATLRAVYTKGATSVTINKTYMIAKAKAGANSQLVSLSATSQVFRVAKDGQASPTEITLSALANNLSGTTSFSVVTGTATLTGTGSSRIITYSNMSTDTVTIRVTWDGKTDDITLVKVREGIDGIDPVTGFLTNEAALIPAATDGALTQSLSTVGGTFKVFKGITDVTGTAVTYSAVNPVNMTATIDTSGVYTITGLSADAGSITFRAVYGGVTIDKTYSLAKSKAGSIGVNGQRGTVSVSRAVIDSAWSDTEANTALSGAGYGAAVNRDIVTLYNTSASFSQSRYYDTPSATWKTLDAYISGNLLLDGSVSSASLTTGAVQAKHLAVSNSGNILSNSGPARGTANWSTSGNSTGLAFGSIAIDTTWCPTGANAVSLRVVGTPAAATVFELANNNGGRRYPVKPTTRYEVSAYLSMHRATGNIYLYWYDANGALLSEGAVGSAVSTTHDNKIGIDSFGRSIGFVTSPANAATALFAIRATVIGTADPYIYCSMAYMGEANPSQTAYSSWAEGGMTTISPGMIDTTTLSAISANLGSINAGSLNINSKFIVDSQGNTTIRSSTTGARLELSSNKIIVHDGTRERVRLGYLL